jgi:hypothetical protein
MQDVHHAPVLLPGIGHPPHLLQVPEARQRAYPLEPLRPGQLRKHALVPVRALVQDQGRHAVSSQQPCSLLHHSTAKDTFNHSQRPQDGALLQQAADATPHQLALVQRHFLQAPSPACTAAAGELFQGRCIQLEAAQNEGRQLRWQRVELQGQLAGAPVGWAAPRPASEGARNPRSRLRSLQKASPVRPRSAPSREQQLALRLVRRGQADATGCSGSLPRATEVTLRSSARLGIVVGGPVALGAAPLSLAVYSDMEGCTSVATSARLSLGATSQRTPREATWAPRTSRAAEQGPARTRSEGGSESERI